MAEDMITLGKYFTLFLDESPERSDDPLTIEVHVALVSFFEAVESSHLQCADLFCEKPLLNYAVWSLHYRSKTMRFLRR
jgi:hypothetical protein